MSDECKIKLLSRGKRYKVKGNTKNYKIKSPKKEENNNNNQPPKRRKLENILKKRKDIKKEVTKTEDYTGFIKFSTIIENGLTIITKTKQFLKKTFIKINKQLIKNKKIIEMDFADIKGYI